MPDLETSDAPAGHGRGAEKAQPESVRGESSLLSRWRLLGAAVHNPKLSRCAIAVLYYIVDCINKDGIAWPSVRDIARKCETDKRTVTRSVRLLVESGLLIRSSGNRTDSNIYRLGTGSPAPTVGATLPLGESEQVGAELSLGYGRVCPKGRGEPAHVTYLENLPKKPTQNPRKKRVSSRVEQTFTEWTAQVGSRGETCIPSGDPIFTWAEKAGIPTEYLYLAWRAFEDKHTDSGKRYADWRAVFRNAVKGNWMKVWFFEEAGGCRLTTVGIQFQRVVEADESQAATHGGAR